MPAGRQKYERALIFLLFSPRCWTLAHRRIGKTASHDRQTRCQSFAALPNPRSAILMPRWFRRQSAPKTSRTARSHRARLMVQGLEGRVVPATFTVLNANDAGAGSLRQAILDANTAAGADTIVFGN